MISLVKGVRVAVEYDVFIRFFTEAMSVEEATNFARSISDLIYRQFGIDSAIDEITEHD